ncbi:hypothetical protein BDV11DRAFT_180251 [Aspergillus similis]
MHRYSQSGPESAALLWGIDFLALLLKGQANQNGSGWLFSTLPQVRFPRPHLDNYIEPDCCADISHTVAIKTIWFEMLQE